MSRIDLITITIVGICLVVLIYLLVRIANINEPGPTFPTENSSLLIDSSSILAQLDTSTIDTPASITTKPKEVTPANPPTKSTIKENPNGRFLVVAASFNTLELAEQEQGRLAQLGYTNSEIGYFNQRKIVAVIVGRYDSYDAAQTVAQQMQTQHKVAAYVHRKRG